MRTALNKVSMREQFACHALGGWIDVAGQWTFNLEKWRPTRTTHWSSAVAQHRCNWSTSWGL
ncbi:MAG: DUF2599 domain-containing protein [Mycetocola sp.]